MTDKELLELAAKAAGFEIDARASFMTWRENNLIALLNSSGGHSLWNPLTDDGDALRLAVKLELMINPIDGEINVYDGGDVDVYQHIEGEPYAATRRAIVRAAAEIGKSL